jgi:uncharacterized protein
MPHVSKPEADAHDKIIDAASELADLIEQSGMALPERTVEDLSIFLARNGPAVREMLKPVKRSWPADESSA